jgi:hypothetical protein
MADSIAMGCVTQESRCDNALGKNDALCAANTSSCTVQWRRAELRWHCVHDSDDALWALGTLCTDIHSQYGGECNSILLLFVKLQGEIDSREHPQYQWWRPGTLVNTMRMPIVLNGL